VPVYVDQASKLSFTYLQKTATANKTLEGKTAFKNYARNQGVKVKAYHANNGIFKVNKWVLACRENNQ
jgi:phage tail protein X